MTAELFAIIAPVFVAAGIGFAWARLGQHYETDFVTLMVTRIGTPCLVFSTLTKLSLSPAVFGEIALAAVLALACFAVAGYAVLRATGRSSTVFLPTLMFPNGGNMGLPICLFAFGEAGLALAISVFAVWALAQFTIGYRMAAGRIPLAGLLKTPLIYAVLLALAFMFAEARPPGWIANSTELIGGMTIPLMLVTLGVSLARLQVRRLPLAVGLSVLRLAGGFAVGWALAAVLGLEGIARGVLIIECAMPVAVFNYLFAQLHNRKPEDVAGAVVISTALSFATLPGLLLFVLP